MEAIDCFLFISTEDEVIPLWNEIAQWASVMTERNSTIHATTSLLLQVFK
jgi:hypothetical protein